MKKLRYPIILTSSIRNFNGSLIAKAQTRDNNDAVVIFENKQCNIFIKINVSSVLLYPNISDESLRKFKSKYKKIIFKAERRKKNIRENIKIQKIQKKLFYSKYDGISKKDIKKSKIEKQKRINELLSLRSGKDPNK